MLPVIQPRNRSQFSDLFMGSGTEKMSLGEEEGNLSKGGPLRVGFNAYIIGHML